METGSKKKKTPRLALLFLTLFLGGAATPSYLLLVDKKRGELLVAEYALPKYRILKKYPVTVGLSEGAKNFEGDFKTPEGIYFFTQLLRPPVLKPKFGKLAFYVNYPNPVDRAVGRTGYDILLHGTDEPKRLSYQRDSEGCVVVKDAILKQLQPYIQLRKTPFLIFHEIQEDDLFPLKDQELISFFRTWLQAWQSKDMKTYLGSYHLLFRSDGKDLQAWKRYKIALAKRYGRIRIEVQNVEYFRHPFYQLVRFHQKYTSFFPNGQKAYVSQGTKLLYVVRSQGKYQILREDFFP